MASSKRELSDTKLTGNETRSYVVYGQRPEN